eukprot:TRINITY_DN950_c1_g1_i2.p1 TRINITY_DN950_c1_g1~~TRINITY_DN950_c1_g1_i2.p1  ORF type:complete len:415 (+),score=136.15 TRINITY_DN950_c1_g1_i2:140-1384(+)
MSRDFCHEIIQMVIKAGDEQDVEVITMDGQSEDGKALRKQASALREQKIGIEQQLAALATQLRDVEAEERARELANMSSVVGVLKQHIEETQRRQAAADVEVAALKAKVKEETEAAALWKQKYVTAQLEWAGERKVYEQRLALSSEAPTGSRRSTLEDITVEELALPAAAPPACIAALGIDVLAVAEGVLVKHVTGNSVASRAGVRADDVIIDFASTPVKTVADLVAICDKLPTTPFPAGLFRRFEGNEPRLLWKIVNQSSPALTASPSPNPEINSPVSSVEMIDIPSPPRPMQLVAGTPPVSTATPNTRPSRGGGAPQFKSTSASPARRMHPAPAKGQNSRDDQLVFRKAPDSEPGRLSVAKAKVVIPKLNLQIFPQNAIGSKTKVPLNHLGRKVSRSASHGNAKPLDKPRFA